MSEHEAESNEGELLGRALDSFLEDLFDGRATDLGKVARADPDLETHYAEAYELAKRATGAFSTRFPEVFGYEILREIGRGGMGAVFLARRVECVQPIALKVLPAGITMSPRLRRRFLEESRVMQQLVDDHIVRVHRVVDEGETLAFEMEWIEGASLRQVLHAMRRLGPAASIEDLAKLLGCPGDLVLAPSLAHFYVRLAIDITRALQKVHELGLVHRDVKPSNILLRKNGRAVLSDFGLVRDLDSSMTHTAGFVGTPVYASPEQLRAGDKPTVVDGRSDTYSLGVTLYECLAGRPPFVGSTSTSLARQVEEGTFRPLRKLCPRLPRDLETIVHKSIDPVPDQRYSSASELGDDLQRLLSLEPIRSRRPGRLRRCVRWAQRHRRVLASAAIGAGLVVATLIPLLLLTLASARRPGRIQHLLEQARQKLLDPSARHEARNWLASVVRAEHPSRALRSLQDALWSYDEALGYGANPDLAHERSVVNVALCVLADDLDRIEVHTIEELPSVTRQLVWNLCRGVHPARAMWRSLNLREATDQDRWLTGLLAFLLADERGCQRAWQRLEVVESAFGSAALGLVMLDDGLAERAYSRLFHAHHRYPNTGFLVVELAHAALASGDLGLADQWLRRAESERASHRYRLAKARLDLARGRLEHARAVLRLLVREYPQSLDVIQCFGELELASNNTEAALERFGSLVASGPGQPRHRLCLARAAVKAKRPHLYLEQLNWALSEILRRPRTHWTPGAREHMAAIIRVAGFGRIWRWATRRLEAAVLPDRDVPAPAAMFHGVHDSWPDFESWLYRAAVFENLRWPRIEPWSGPGSGLARVCAAMSRLTQAFPQAITLLPISTRGPGLLAASCLANARRWWSVTTTCCRVLQWWAPRRAGHQILAEISYDLGADWDRDGRRDELHRNGDTILVRSSKDGRVLNQTDNCRGFVCAEVDVDRDGVRDLLISGESDHTFRGRAELRSGNRVLWSRVGGHPVERFGSPVLAPGDLDGDGWTDLVIGAPSNAAHSCGHCYVVSGRWVARREGRELLTVLSGRFEMFGSGLAALGDLNGDARADFAVADAAGRVVVYSGLEILGSIEPDHLWSERTLARAGDVDADGTCDLLVANPDFDGASGVVAIYSGASIVERKPRVIHRWVGGLPGDALGFSAVALGDVDADGHDDVAVGAPQFRNTLARGYVSVLSGRTGAVLWTQSGDPGQHLGMVLQGIGDFDGDGTHDITAKGRAEHRSHRGLVLSGSVRGRD